MIAVPRNDDKGFNQERTSSMNLHKVLHFAMTAVTTVGLLLPATIVRAEGNNPPAQKIIKAFEISVDRGCGATYQAGEQIEIEVSVPEAGWLTVWQEVNGDQYQLSGPEWVEPDEGFDISGMVQPPVGQEEVMAYLDGESGESYSDSCHYTTEMQAYYPELECELYLPDEVHAGQEFEIEVKVWNSGNAKAKKVMLYGKATPSGYFQIHSCSPNCNGTKTSLGQIKPNKSKWASYWVTAPEDQAGDFTFEFWVEAHGGVDAYCGSHDLSVLGGQFFKVPPSQE
jgi:hypothetical protein